VEDVRILGENDAAVRGIHTLKALYNLILILSNRPRQYRKNIRPPSFFEQYPTCDLDFRSTLYFCA
jgi:hypothetical protein